MTVAEAPRTPLPPPKASPLAKWGQDLGCLHRLRLPPRGRRGRPSPRSTRDRRSVRSKARASPPIAASLDRAPTSPSVRHPLSFPRTPHTSEPRQGPQKLLRPRARRPAHPQQPSRPDKPAKRGKEGPHLKEGDGAVDGPVCTCASGERLPLCVSRVCERNP
jgi:hypothetical protein